MDAHKATHQLRSVILDLIEAEKFTNAPSCIGNIRKAVHGIYRVADDLGLDLAKQVDPMM